MDNNVRIDTDTLNNIGALINMQAYADSNVPRIFVANFFALEHLQTYQRKRKFSNFTATFDITNALNTLKFRCSKITMFPFLIHGTFMVAILIREKAKAYVLKCNGRNDIRINNEIKVACYTYIFIVNCH